MRRLFAAFRRAAPLLARRPLASRPDSRPVPLYRPTRLLKVIGRLVPSRPFRLGARPLARPPLARRREFVPLGPLP